MKLIFQQSDLAESVNIVLKAVSSKTTMPILECILIDATEGEIRFTANDMEMGIETIVKGTIEEKGKIALDAKIFSDIVRKLPNNTVVFETSPQNLVMITCEKAKFDIPGRDADEFPMIPLMEYDSEITISQFSLRETIRQTIFSLAMNENNKLMTGELFEIRNNSLRVVSLDGHRISIRNLELKDNCPDLKVVIPGKTLNEISKILTGDIEDTVHISFSDNYVLFTFDRTTVLSRLIDGEYFRIDQMLSTDYETKMVVNRMAMSSIIDRASLLVRESDKMPIIMDIHDETAEMKISTTLGSMNEDLSVEKTGADLAIGFNPRFLLDAFRAIDDEEISMYFVNAKAPCFIRDDAGTYVYLILPVNFR